MKLERISLLRTAFIAVAGAALLAASACGELDTDSMTDDLAGIEAPGLRDKADSATRPSAQGELLINVAATKSLSTRSGFHSFTFAGRQGAKVRFALKSRAYRTYLRITSPAGTRWNVVGVRKDGAWYAQRELTLRMGGTYKVLVTSYENLYYGQMRSRGEYTQSAEGDRVVTDDCASLNVATCDANPRCEIVAVGCEQPSCDRDTGVCHACDPIPVCKAKAFSREGEGCGSRGLLPCAAGLFCAFAAGSHCGETDAGGTCARRAEVCIQIYQPVCGCDGHTYGSSCTASSAGMSVRTTGECSPR